MPIPPIYESYRHRAATASIRSLVLDQLMNVSPISTLCFGLHLLLWKMSGSLAADCFTMFTSLLLTSVCLLFGSRQAVDRELFCSKSELKDANSGDNYLVLAKVKLKASSLNSEFILSLQVATQSTEIESNRKTKFSTPTGFIPKEPKEFPFIVTVQIMT